MSVYIHRPILFQIQKTFSFDSHDVITVDSPVTATGRSYIISKKETENATHIRKVKLGDDYLASEQDTIRSVHIPSQCGICYI